VGKVLSVKGSRATVKVVETGGLAEVDVSMVDAKKDSYLEIFADTAIGRLTKKEAEYKISLKREVLSMAVGAVR
jgi:hydrogenase maturation factor